MSSSLYRKQFDLTGRTAIVTGGAGILGTRFCTGLAEHGANVAVVDIDGEKAHKFALELSDIHRIKSIGIGCDVSSVESVNSMLKTVINELGDIDILHNNAATKSRSLDDFFAPFEEYSYDAWKQVMSVNLDGMFLIAQAVGKQMVKQEKGGTIIQTSSIYGLVGPDNRIYDGSFYLGKQINTPAVYSASKGGVIALTKYLATYWGDKGIRVNTLIPGGVESGQNEEFKKRYSNRVPMGRMGLPDEMVGALIYLASDASSYVTGQCIVVDGGFTAW